MSEKHYPYIGGSFDRIIFDGDGSVWVPEAENAKLRELVRDMWHAGAFEAGACYEKAAERLEEKTRELGIDVDS